MMVVASPEGLTRPPFHEAIQLPFRECSKGESFGPSWSTHWFRVTLRIPHDFLKKVISPLPSQFREKTNVNQERIEFHFDCDCEGMIWTTGGLPLQGLTGGGGGDRRVEFILPQEWRNEPDSPHVPPSTSHIPFPFIQLSPLRSFTCITQGRP